MRRKLSIALGLLAMTTACQTSQLITPFNELPVADAKVLKMGIPVEAARDGSIADLVFPYAGQPVAITLDGNSSYDSDGKIVGFRWLSGTRVPDAGLPPPWTPDAGTPEPFLRLTPAGVEGALEQPSPTIMVGAGVWAFALWVLDDQGAWSSPDTIRFIVGDPPPIPRDGGASDAGLLQDAGTIADAAVFEAGVAPDAGTDAGQSPLDGGIDASDGTDAGMDAAPVP